MRTMRPLWITAALAAALALPRCTTADNYLDGSLADSYGIDFDYTRIRLYSSELSVEYIQDSEGGERIALRVTVDVAGQPLSEGGSYDLAERGTVDRGQGFGSTLPDLESGELTLDRYAAQNGAEVKGSFDATFVAADDSTLTLRGGFAAEMELVDI